MTGGGDDFTARRAPTLADFELIAVEALKRLPEEFRRLAGEVQLRVAEFPDDDVLEEMRAQTEFDILGLFQGVGMAHGATVPDTGELPNMIWLYRRPILDYWTAHDETLGSVIRHVLIHEIGHHFGLSDADMEAIEAAAE